MHGKTEGFAFAKASAACPAERTLTATAENEEPPFDGAGAAAVALRGHRNTPPVAVGKISGRFSTHELKPLCGGDAEATQEANERLPVRASILLRVAAGAYNSPSDPLDSPASWSIPTVRIAAADGAAERHSGRMQTGERRARGRRRIRPAAVSAAHAPPRSHGRNKNPFDGRAAVLPWCCGVTERPRGDVMKHWCRRRLSRNRACPATACHAGR